MREKLEQISFKDFEKLYQGEIKESWDFTKFKIKCVKCNSENVEYAGEADTENGYYGDIEFEHKIIIKCHDCGNALALKVTADGSNNWCPECH